MDDLTYEDRQRALADAILLERAQRVLERRHPDGLAVVILGEYARELRREAGAGPADPQILRVVATDAPH